MAIAGTGGWTPSCRVIARNGTLVATGHVTNKPPELIYSDEERRAAGTLRDALPRLRRGEAVQCDMTNGQFLKLIGLWNEFCTVAEIRDDEAPAQAGGLGSIAECRPPDDGADGGP